MCYATEDLACFDTDAKELENAVEMLPICSDCEKPIEDEFCYVINGENICEECMDQYKQPTAYLMR